jgi:arsenate reductase
MAEGFLRSFDPSLDVFSAGTQPARTVHPLAVQVMRETGIDISGYRPKNVEGFLVRSFDYVVTVCDGARESCPVFSGTVRHRMHLGFEDPAGAEGTDDEVLAVFRRVRDEIMSRFRQFCNDIATGG